MALIGSLVTVVKANTTNFNKNMTMAAKKTDNLSSRMGFAAKAALGFSTALGGIALGLGARSLFRIGKEATTVASDFVEAQQKFGVVFESIRDEAEKTRDSLSKNFGLSKKAATELLSGTGDLLTGFGMADSAALEMSNNVQMLAVDLASFSNIEGGAARASEILTKALLGERDALVSLGVKISDTDVQQKLLEKGQKDLTGQALLAAKAQATYELILEQTTKAQGDFARSSDSLANKQRVLNARFEDAQALLGTELLPIQTAVTNQLIKLAEKTTGWIKANKGVINSGIMKFVEGLAAGLAFMADTLELGVAAWNFFAAGAKIALAGILTPLALLESAVNALMEQMGADVPEDPPIARMVKDLVASAEDSAVEFTKAMDRFNNATKSTAVRDFFAEVMREAEAAAKAVGLVNDEFAGAGAAASGTKSGRHKDRPKDDKGARVREFITVDLRNMSLRGPQAAGKSTEEKQLDEQKKTNEFLMAIAAQGVAGRGTARPTAQ